MSHLIYVNPTLAIGLRKRLLRETGQDFSAALECLFRDVVPKGCQRFGSTHRRVVAYIKRHFRNRIVREVRQGTGRREVWACELLLPEQPNDPTSGALALIRVGIKRRDPLMPDFTNVGVRVSQHLVERVLQRRGDGAWDMAALTTELRPALNIASRWQEEHLVRNCDGHWQLPTRGGLAFCVADTGNTEIHFTTWVREDQLHDQQRAARTELLRRIASFDLRSLATSIRVVCGPRTAAALASVAK